MLELFSTCGSYAKKLSTKENFDNCPNEQKKDLHYDHFTNNGIEVADKVANNVVENVNMVVNQLMNKVANNNVANQEPEEVEGPSVSDTLNEAVANTLNNIKDTVNAVENNKVNEVLNNGKKQNQNQIQNAKQNLCRCVGLEPEAPTALACLLLALLLIISILPVVLIAVNVFPKNPILHGTLAFLFDRIYLFIIVILKLKPIANVLTNCANNKNNKNNKMVVNNKKN